MAFNWQTFKTRTLTAILFAAVMLVGLLWNQWSFFILFSIIHFGCWWEYLKLGEKIYNTSIDRFIKYFFCTCGYLVFLAVGHSHYSFDFLITLFGIKLSLKWGLLILTVVCLFAFLLQNKKIPLRTKWFTVAGLIYISVSWGLMLDLSPIKGVVISDNLIGPIYPVVIIATIWINDTMAYIGGSLLGKTPLSKISPKKTWEGTVIGIILAVSITSWLIGSLLIFTNWIEIISASLIASIFGTFGDLFESKLKRMAGVKDSGNFMPGHGGFLDRFDSMLLATPAVWLYVQLFI